MYHDPDPISSEKRQRAQELICYAYLMTERLPLEDLFRHIAREPIE
jgi:hypothetical protein